MSLNYLVPQSQNKKFGHSRPGSLLINPSTKATLPGTEIMSIGSVDGASSPIKKKTLVLSLNHTLISIDTEIPEYPHIGVLLEFDGYESIVYVARRPGLREFLSRLRRCYDICVFTTHTMRFTNAVLETLNVKHYIKNVFGREDCQVVEGPKLLKDLDKLGESPENIVFIDDSTLQTNVHYENSIKISSFNGDENDTELFDHIPFLEALAHVPDVRPVPEKFTMFQSGEDLLKTQQDEMLVEVEKENSFKKLFGKILNSLVSKKSQETDEIKSIRRRRIMSEVIVTPTKLLSAQESQRNSVNNRKSIKLDISPILNESIASMGSLEISLDLSSSRQPGPLFYRRSALRDDDESDHSILMDEVSEGQRRKSLIKPSFPMRIKSRSSLIL